MNTVALVGTGGYGLRHLLDLLQLHRDGRIELVALVDVAPTDAARQLVAEYSCSAAWHSDLVTADTVVIATPPHTHFDLARQAILAGSAVYLEKPPVTLLADLDALEALPARRRVEVGFQQAGATVAALRKAWDEVGRPEVTQIVAYGMLRRQDSYYERSRWAGEWFLDGQAVLDGPLFNPLAHVVQAAMLLADRFEPAWEPARVDAECYRSRPINGDDISAVQVTPRSGPSVLAVGTTSSDVVVPPAVMLHTTEGVVRVVAVSDGASALEATVTDPDGVADPLLSLASTRNFVLTVNAAVQAVGAPGTIPRRAGLARLLAACVRSAALPSEVDPALPGMIGSLDVDGYRGLVHAELDRV